MEVIPFQTTHWPEVARIYQEGIDTGFATFETRIPSFEQWDNKCLQHSRLVAVDEQGVTGWASLAPVSSREVYKGVAEVSVYVGSDSRNKGTGFLLLQTLIRSSEEQGIWTLQSSIFPENIGSISIHLKAGFRYLGRREKIAQRDTKWKDNLIFERRSKISGT